MRTLVLLLMALLPGIALANDVPKSAQPKSAQPKKVPPVVANPCAQYGTGFVQLPGTTTCVRATGSIQVDVGRSGSAR
jgi:Porin subfamily